MFYTIYADLCYQIGKSPSYVAEKLGINKSAVTYWQNNEKAMPRSDTLRKIAEFFNVSINYLKGEEPPYNTEDVKNIRFAAYKELETADDATVEDVLSYIRFKKSQKKDDDQ